MIENLEMLQAVLASLKNIEHGPDYVAGDNFSRERVTIKLIGNKIVTSKTAIGDRPGEFYRQARAVSDAERDCIADWMEVKHIHW